MLDQTTSRLTRSFLYGGGSALLALDVFLLIRAIFTNALVPLLPIFAGVLTAAGLLLIVYSEQRAREEDRRSHLRLSRVSNQLTTPLQQLRDDIQHFLQHASALPSAQRLLLKRMETKSLVLLDNVRDVFLTLQALEGPISTEIRMYDLCVIVQEAYERCRPLASAHNVEFITKHHCLSAPVKVDKHLLGFVLQHVLENAILYTLTPGMVNIALIRGAKHVRVLVQDRGLGIHRQDIHAVFLPFARGEKSFRYDPDGIGLGLALSRLILREFHGSIKFRKRPHTVGTEFEITLPLANAS